MMADKTRLFQDHRAEELITSPSPSTRKRISRGVSNFDSHVGDREKQNAVLSSTYDKFTQNPAKTKYVVSSGNKLLAESSPLDPVWRLGFLADNPRANSPCQWRETISSVRHFLPFAKLFAAVRPGRRTRPPLVALPPALRMQEPINFVPATAGPFTAASSREISPSEFLTYLSGELAK